MIVTIILIIQRLSKKPDFISCVASQLISINGKIALQPAARLQPLLAPHLKEHLVLRKDVLLGLRPTLRIFNQYWPEITFIPG